MMVTLHTNSYFNFRRIKDLQKLPDKFAYFLGGRSGLGAVIGKIIVNYLPVTLVASRQFVLHRRAK